jgi:hypothetical protein
MQWSPSTASTASTALPMRCMPGRRALVIARQSVLAGMGLSIAAMAVAAFG